MSRKLLATAFTALLLLVSCGDDDSDTATDAGAGQEVDDGTTTTQATADEYATTTAGDDTSGEAVVSTADSEYGEILVDADGRTLYGFTNDTAGDPTCTDACAETWPPVFVESGELPEGLDQAVFSVVDHPSGQSQLKAGDWPLYRYAPDAAPGDTNGQGVGGRWFVVDAHGQLVMG